MRKMRLEQSNKNLGVRLFVKSLVQVRKNFLQNLFDELRST